MGELNKMTSFKNIFGQMAKVKVRSIYLLILIQLVTSIIIAIWALLSGFSGFKGQDKLMAWFIFMLTLMPFIDIAYVFISSRQNEKEFDSQTWRLIPVSSSNFYIANISSSIVNGLYLVVLQLIMGFISFLPALFDHNVRFSFWQLGNVMGKEASSGNLWSKFNDTFPVGLILSEFVNFLLFAFLVYSIVATIDLSSKTIMDFLPEKHSKFFRAVIILVLVLILIVASGNIMHLIYQFDPANILTGQIRSYSSVWFSNLFLLMFSIVFSGINVWLLEKYHESK